MKRTLNLALVGLASVVSTGAFAQTVSVAGPFDFVDTLTGTESGLNTFVPNAATVGTDYIFGTAITVDSINVTSVLSATWESEARVRLVNSAFPTQNVQLNFSSTNAVFGTFSISSPTVRPYTVNTMGSANIPSGSTWDVTFFESFNDGPGPDATGDNLVMTPQQLTPFDPATVAVDLGSIDSSTSPVVTVVPTLSAAEVKWYRFSIPADADLNNGNWLDIWTALNVDNGNTVTVDSEVGVYNTSGTLVASDDDDSDGLWSALSFGAGVNPAFGTGAAFDGRDGTLVAGTYYMAVGRFNVTYGPIGFIVSSTGAATIVPFDLTLASNMPGGSNQTLSGTLNLNDTVFGGAYTRTITGTVKQGATTVGTITVSGINSSSTTFSGDIPASATGAATIEWDGSSFLLRKTNITLTGSNLAVGTVSMQNGDVDGSGEVDAADIDEVIANFGSGDDINSDVDVSGEVDAADIDIVIANFGGTDD